MDKKRNLLFFESVFMVEKSDSRPMWRKNNRRSDAGPRRESRTKETPEPPCGTNPLAQSHPQRRLNAAGACFH
jgi:hypothetical protein